MFSLKSTTIAVVSVSLFASSCGLWRSAENQNVNASAVPFTVKESKSDVPFSTKEPDVYQAEIVLTNYASDEKSERRNFTWRSGAKLRCDYENKISILQRGENESFLIYHGKKIYADNQTNSAATNETSDSLKDFPTTEWLNGKRAAKFENLGAADGLTKFRVTLEDAANSDAETLIYIDENLKIPVKQEFYTASGEQKILVFSMELQNIKLEADDKFFELPKDFRKVSTNEFQKVIRQENAVRKIDRND